MTALPFLDPQQPWYQGTISPRLAQQLHAKLTGKRQDDGSEYTSFVKLSTEDADKLIANLRKDPRGYPQMDDAGGNYVKFMENLEAYQKWLVSEYLNKEESSFTEGFTDTTKAVAGPAPTWPLPHGEGQGPRPNIEIPEVEEEEVKEADSTAKKVVKEVISQDILDDMPDSIKTSLAKVISKRTGQDIEVKKERKPGTSNVRMLKAFTEQLQSVKTTLESVDSNLKEQNALIRASLGIATANVSSIEHDDDQFSGKLDQILDAYREQTDETKKAIDEKENADAIADQKKTAGSGFREGFKDLTGSGGRGWIDKFIGVALRRAFKKIIKTAGLLLFKGMLKLLPVKAKWALLRSLAKARKGRIATQAAKTVRKKGLFQRAKSFIDKKAPGFVDTISGAARNINNIRKNPIKAAGNALKPLTHGADGRLRGSGMVDNVMSRGRGLVEGAGNQLGRFKNFLGDKAGKVATSMKGKWDDVAQPILKKLPWERMALAGAKGTARAIPIASTALAIDDIDRYRKIGGWRGWLGGGLAAIDAAASATEGAYATGIGAPIGAGASLVANIAGWGLTAFEIGQLLTGHDPYEKGGLLDTVQGKETGGLTEPGPAILHGTEAVIPRKDLPKYEFGTMNPVLRMLNPVAGNLVAATSSYLSQAGPAAKNVGPTFQHVANQLREEFDVPSVLATTDVGGSYSGIRSAASQIKHDVIEEGGELDVLEEFSEEEIEKKKGGLMDQLKNKVKGVRGWMSKFFNRNQEYTGTISHVKGARKITSGMFSRGFRVKDDLGSGKSAGGHTGLDIGMAEGTPLSLGVSGTVVDIGIIGDSNDPGNENGGYGNFVAIKLDDGHYIKMNHLMNNSIAVGKGTKVNPGMVIGKVGSTGLSTGPHLHIDIGTGYTAGSAAISGLKDPSSFILKGGVLQGGTSSGIAAPQENAVAKQELADFDEQQRIADKYDIDLGDDPQDLINKRKELVAALNPSTNQDQTVSTLSTSTGSQSALQQIILMNQQANQQLPGSLVSGGLGTGFVMLPRANSLEAAYNWKLSNS